MHCIKSQRQVWTWCSCYLSRRFTQSKLDSCFFSLRYTWSSRLLAAFRPALARKAGELITLEAWLAVMALHEANQARSSHYPQWHCGPKLHLLATNDILHLLGKHSTTWPAACTPSSVRATQRCSAKVSSCSVQTVVKASKQPAQSPYLK